MRVIGIITLISHKCKSFLHLLKQLAKRMNNSIGNKLKQLRKKKGLSQEQLSEALHMSQSTYARIENGESNSWSLHLDKITNFFAIKPEELFEQENVVINLNQQGGRFDNAIVINHLSEKLIEQYETRIKEQSEIITQLKSKVK